MNSYLNIKTVTDCADCYGMSGKSMWKITGIYIQRSRIFWDVQCYTILVKFEVALLEKKYRS